MYLICRGDHPIIVYDRKGKLPRARGARATSPTARTASRSRPTARVYCTDDGNHTVRQFTPDGKLLHDARHAEHAVRHRLRRQGLDHHPAPGRAVQPADQPRRRARRATSTSPTATATAACTSSRRAATLKHSWGEPGTGPGQFHLPHGIAVAADGRVFVCDRENDRIQIFSPDGEYLARVDGHAAPDPHRVRRAGARLRLRALVAQGPDLAAPRRRSTTPRHGRVSVFDRDGTVLARWGTPGGDRARQLRGAARPRRRLEGRHLRRRGDVDLRGQPRATRPRTATPSRSSRSGR